MSGCHKIPQKLRRILSSKVLYLFCMTPCPMMRTQPLAKDEDEIIVGKLFTKPKSPKDSGKVFPISTKPSAGKTEQVTVDPKFRMAEESKKFKEVAELATRIESKENMEIIWKYVAVLLDRFLFLVNILIILTSLIGFNLSTTSNE